MKTKIAAICFALLAFGTAHAATTSPDDIDSRIYDGAGFDSTRFTVIVDKVTGVTCFITESQSDSTSPAMKCFTRKEIRND